MKIPLGVRCIVYSYLKFEELLTKISIVNKVEREAIVNSKILDQERQLEIPISEGQDYKRYFYALRLANGINLVFHDILSCVVSLKFLEYVLENHSSKFNTKNYNVIKGA